MSYIEPSHNSNEVTVLVADLASPDPVARQLARESLITLGSIEVTAALLDALNDTREHVRWESAKALAALQDPLSAPGLVNALEDDCKGVRWLAAEGLISLEKNGVIAVLSALTKRAASATFCESAHHVLSDCDQERIAEIVSPVLLALTESEPGVSVPPAAYAALLSLTDGLCAMP